MSHNLAGAYLGGNNFDVLGTTAAFLTNLAKNVVSDKPIVGTGIHQIGMTRNAIITPP